MSTPTYTQLDSQTQLSIVNSRIRDLETQQLQLALRVNAPSPGDVISQQDRDNLTELENSLKVLRDLAASLTSPPSGGTT